MDVVYVVKDDYDNLELKYSLRSLKYISHDDVWIVGYKPIWVSDTVKHIPAVDVHVDRNKNVIDKLKVVCDSIVSDKFILMNDDFIFLEPQDVYNYTIKDLDYLYNNKNNIFKKYISRTIKYCDDLKINKRNFEVHYPMIVNKDDLWNVLQYEIHESDIPCYRSLYGNYYNIGAEEIDEDFKVYKYDAFVDALDLKSFVSLSDGICKPEVFELLRKKFPKQSKYETTVSVSMIEEKKYKK